LCKWRCGGGGRISFPYGKDIESIQSFDCRSPCKEGQQDEVFLLGNFSREELRGIYAFLLIVYIHEEAGASAKWECESQSHWRDGRSVDLDLLEDPRGSLQRAKMIMLPECQERSQGKENRERKRQRFVFRSREIVTASALSSATGQMPGSDADYLRRRGDFPVALAAALGTASTHHGQSILERHTGK